MIYEGVIQNQCHSLCIFWEKKPGWSCKLMDRQVWTLRLDNFGWEIYGDRKSYVRDKEEWKYESDY